MEQTVVLVKPDAVKRGLVSEIIGRFEKIGLKIVAMKMIQIGKRLAAKHYGYDEQWFENVGKKTKDFYKEQGMDPDEEVAKLSSKQVGKLIQKWNIEFITEGPVIAMLIEGPGSVEVVRKMVGSTYPRSSAPGTIRGDFSLDSPFLSNTKKRAIKNLVHASGTVEEAKLERELWFKENEIHSYKRIGEDVLF